MKYSVIYFFLLSIFLSNAAQADSSPIASYRFDEIEYSGTDDEVIDSIGGYHGEAINAQLDEGKVCNAVDLSWGGTSDYVIVPENILNGKSDFTISLWIKTSDTSNQSIVSGSSSGSLNELIMFPRATSFTPYIKGKNNGSITTTSIADDSWHHLVWTRSEEQNCLFIDKVKQGCLEQETGSLAIESIILGQEQDTLGGGFASSQAFDGLLDEVLIFDSAISSEQITQIYDYQNNGFGYDGSERTCLDIPETEAATIVANYLFDETGYANVESEVVDSVGGFNGQANNVQPVEGKICNAADFSASGIDDYVTLPVTILDHKKDFTVSLWSKTSKTSNQSFLSGASTVNNNELIMFTTSTRFNPYLKNSNSSSISMSTISDDNWHHLVWTRSGSRNCLYRDGKFQDCNLLSTGYLTIESLLLGQEQDNVGGGFDSTQAVEGLIDELLIFDGALSTEEIEEIYNNQNNGLDYDGGERSCSSFNYRFDEATWSGSIGEVKDEAEQFNAQSKNGANTKVANPAKTGDPGTCRYGSFDGIDQYIEVPDSFENLLGSFTITAWINPSNTNAGSRIFIDDENNTQGYGFSLGDGGNGTLRFYSRAVNPIIVDTTTSISPDTWTFVTAVHNSLTKTRQIYINGVAQTITGGSTSNTYTGTWGEDEGPASIGGETDLGETNNRFTGDIDEVRVFSRALTESQIASIYTETHSCSSTPIIHHYEIIHDGQGLTCETEYVTIKACSDEDCTSLSSSSVSLDFLANSELIEDSLTFTGSTIVSINNSDVETITFSVDNESISTSSGFVCDDGSNNSCDMEFTDAGFIFISGSNNRSTIPNQTSGTEFSEALKLQAVQNVDGVCTGLFTGDVNINLSQENVDPGGTTGLSFSSDGNTITKYANDTEMTLSFDTDSIATIPAPIYYDAGEIRLHANYNVGDISLSGNSNSFWVSPSKLVISATSGGADINGSTSTATQIHKAGENFDLNVTALNQLGSITQNYSPGQIQLKLMRIAPTSTNSVEGNLTYSAASTLTSNTSATFQDVTLSTFLSGESTYSEAQYSEVGVINLDIQDSNYGGENIIISADDINIGRFTPDHFEITSITDGALSGGNPFVYTGQLESTDSSIGQISYLTEPEFIITAKSANGITTKNYTDTFMKLQVNDVIRVTPSTDSSQKGVDNINKVTLSATLNAATLDELNGMVNYIFSDTDHYIFTREANAIIAPFTTNIDLQIDSIIDDDGITTNDSDSDTSNGILTLSPTGLEIRFGRWYMDNSYGPETTNLRIPMQIQYWDGSSFITNDSDSFTTFDSSDTSITDISLAPSITSVSESGIFMSGETNQLTLSAPSPTNQGAVEVGFSVPSWLQYDWSNSDDNNDGPYNEDPYSEATFGLYRGNDRIIYRGEVFE